MALALAVASIASIAHAGSEKTGLQMKSSEASRNHPSPSKTKKTDRFMALFCPR